MVYENNFDPAMYQSLADKYPAIARRIRILENLYAYAGSLPERQHLIEQHQHELQALYSHATVQSVQGPAIPLPAKPRVLHDPPDDETESDEETESDDKINFAF